MLAFGTSATKILSVVETVQTGLIVGATTTGTTVGIGVAIMADDFLGLALVFLSIGTVTGLRTDVIWGWALYNANSEGSGATVFPIEDLGTENDFAFFAALRLTA